MGDFVARLMDIAEPVLISVGRHLNQQQQPKKLPQNPRQTQSQHPRLLTSMISAADKDG